MVVEVKPFDPAEYLDDPESLAAYLEDAIEDGNPSEFLEALGVVARAKGMTEIARDIKVARPALYRSLQASGHPDFGTVLSVLRSLGVELRLVPARSTQGAA